MPDNHIQRGFLDDSRLDNVPVRAFETSSSIGKIIESQKERLTETAAEDSMIKGRQHEATDTLADMEAKGLFRCSHSGEWLPREAFSPDARKRNGLQSICKAHHLQHERQREAQRYQQALERYRYRKARE